MLQGNRQTFDTAIKVNGKLASHKLADAISQWIELRHGTISNQTLRYTGEPSNGREGENHEDIVVYE